MKRTLIILAVALIATAHAQTPPATVAKPETPPVLSEVDRLKVINALQAVELATLKMQVAAADLTRVRGEADKVISAVSVPGWVLTEKLEFVRPPKGGEDR